MANLSIRNQYRGINAHLHSRFQDAGGWDSFHTLHIGHLATALQKQLRGMGYIAEIEQSLQIKRPGEKSRSPTSDVTIYDPDKNRSLEPATATGQAALTIALPALLSLSQEKLQHYRAIGLYVAKARKRDPGDAVAWLELLSPSNKPGGRDAADYQEKRLKILQAGIVFVELDYLHESAPTFASVASYRTRNGHHEDDIYPYRIAVIDPRPDFYTGRGHLYQFRVDDPIPTTSIPLNADDILQFDFDAPYQRSYEEMFYGDSVDYSTLPRHFERYRDVDKARILNRLLAVLDAAARGNNLETATIIPQTLSLADAQHAFETQYLSE